jgi:hypothetical protein
MSGVASEVFRRHRGLADSLGSSGFTRLGATGAQQGAHSPDPLLRNLGVLAEPAELVLCVAAAR